MVMIVNTTAAMKSMATKIIWNKVDDSGRRSIKVPGKLYNFVPGQMVVLDDKEFSALENIPMMKRCLDNGDFATGREAKKVAAKAAVETVQQEKDDADKKKAKE